MFGKSKEFSLEVRGRATGMVESEMKLASLVSDVGVGLRTLKYWLKQYRSTGNLDKKKRS